MSRPRFRIDPEALRSRRAAAVMSRAQLAKETGLSRRRIENIENGDTGTRPETIHALAKALGCKPTDLAQVDESKPTIEEVAT